jgi:hypothetical protein
MGAWGTGPFENDTAMDWTYELPTTEIVAFLNESLQPAIGYVDEVLMPQEIAERAVAASAVVAAMDGHLLSGLPQEVIAKLATAGKAPIDLIVSTKMALACVLANSELNVLWQESEDGKSWENKIEALLARLKAEQKTRPIL